MKLTIKTLLGLLIFNAPVVAFAETLTIEGDLEVEGNIEAGSASAFGRYSVINSKSNTIGAINKPNFGNAFLYLANSDGQHELGFDPNQIVANVDSYLHIWNAHPSGGIMIRTGGSSADSRTVCIDKNGKVGIGTKAPSAKLEVAGDVKADLRRADRLAGYSAGRNGFASGIHQQASTNFLYAADKRFEVDINNFKSGQSKHLFDDNYEQHSTNNIAAGKTATVSIDLLPASKARVPGISHIGLTYTQGSIYISFYWRKTPTAVTGRLKVRKKVDGKNTWEWKTIEAERMESLGRVWAFRIPNWNYLQAIELSITAPEDNFVRLMEVEYHLNRPGAVETANVTKYGPQRTHHNLSFHNDQNQSTIQLDAAAGTVTAKGFKLSDGTIIDLGNASALQDSRGNAVVQVAPDGKVGIGVASPSEKLELNGAILIGTTTNSNSGTIRFEGDDFEGRTSAGWVSLTASSGVSGSGEAYKLTTPDESSDVIVVDASGDTSVSGAMTFTASMGDIPMFGR